jgi:outer membrane protein TolC
VFNIRFEIQENDINYFCNHIGISMRKLAIIAMIFSALFQFELRSEERVPLSLAECVNRGLKNNIGLRKQSLEKSKNEYKIKETISKGLPQIDGFVQTLDNIKKMTTLMPGSLMGRPGTNLELEMGTQYSTSAGFKVNQLIYSQTYLLSIEISEKIEKLSDLNYEKAEEELIYNIGKLYTVAAFTKEQIGLITENITRLDSIAAITQVQVENGYAKQVDLDRAIVSKSNLQIQLENSMNLYRQQLALIKYYINEESDIDISENIKSLINNDPEQIQENSINELKDMQLLELQHNLNQDQISVIKYEYLPTLSFISQFQYQNMREDLKMFGVKWYGNAYIGLSLNFSIFDGFNKKNRIAQAEIEREQTQLDINSLKSYSLTKICQAKSDYENNISALNRQKKNIDLAKNIVELSRVRHSEGSLSMSDLISDEAKLTESEMNYLNTRMQLINSELELLKSSGKLKNLTK